MVVEPGDTAVTPPLADTDATAGFALLHTTGRPVNTLLNASRADAIACVALPTVIVDAVNETATLATGASPIEIGAVPERPSLVAMIVDAPTDTPVTAPVVAAMDLTLE